MNAWLRSSAAGSNGFCGASQGASSAPPMQITVNRAAPTATGDWRKLYATSWPHRARRFTSGDPRSLQRQGFLDQRSEEACAQRNHVVVEVVARVVQVAVVRPAALAEKHIRTRTR